MNGSVTELEVTGVASGMSGLFAKPEVIRGVSLANEAATQ